MKRFMTSEWTESDNSLFDLRFLRLRWKNRASRISEMRTSPPIMPPLIALRFVDFPGEELLDELPDGTLVGFGEFEDIDDGAFC